MKIRINNRIICETSKPYIIAELGVNYYDIAKKENISVLAAAKKMIKSANVSGADAVKFQTYKAEKIASINSPAYWDTSEEPTTSQYELFKKYDHLDENDYKKLAKFSIENNIHFLSTPFDFESADFLDKLMPVFKISSSDITNLPFIEYIASKRKPIFLSTGASTMKEIHRAVETILEENNDQIVLMHCILNYPTSYEDANLGMITHLKTEFPTFLSGYSDHTVPDPDMAVLTTSAILGAKIIEKHFTLDKTLLGNDHYHSMDSNDLKKFREKLQFIQKILGSYQKTPLDSEIPARKYARRSIVAARDIEKGDRITRDMLTFKRPGIGIEPSEIGTIIGKIAVEYIEKDEILLIEKIRNQ